jgi:predicted ester cyclase
VKDWYASWATAFPDAVAGATVVCASGDAVAVEGLFEGTNTGDFGPLPATGKSVSLRWANVLRFDGAGRVVAGSAYYDQLTIMIELGHIDAPAST